MSELETVLSRLDRVRGRDLKWTAACPAHPDKTASLYVTGTYEGKVMLHCFAGCDTRSVLAAIGLTFADLFPPRDFRRAAKSKACHQKPLRKRYDYDQVNGLVWVSAVDWSLQTEFQGLRWASHQERLYDRWGPSLKPSLIVRPPAWAIAARKADGSS